MLIERHIDLPMKKTTTKLQLTTNTIRVLHDDQLGEVAGGAPTAECTNVGPTCSGISDRCSDHCSRHCPSRHCH
jgi:hypothetical protein